MKWQPKRRRSAKSCEVTKGCPATNPRPARESRPRLGSFPWPRPFSTNRASTAPRCVTSRPRPRCGRPRSYYFESKEELLWAVWEKGGLELLHRVADAIVNKTDPWQRMETACIAHTTGLLDWRRANQALFIMPPWHYPESIKARVIALRDEYEKIFIGLIDDLPLRKGVDRRYLRLAVIGALSWSLFWFKKERDTPGAIAKQMLSMLRAGIEDPN